MGIISAIGNSAEENLAALQQGRTGLSHTDYIDTIHKKSLLFGEIKYSNCDFEKLLNLPESNRFPRTAMLATFAAKQAVENAGITDINAYKTGFVSATSVGGMDMTELYFYEYEKIRLYKNTSAVTMPVKWLISRQLIWVSRAW